MIQTKYLIAKLDAYEAIVQPNKSRYVEKLSRRFGVWIPMA